MNKKNLKVLLFGYNQTNFILPIYRHINEQLEDEFSFYAFNLLYFGHTQNEVEPYIQLLDNNFRKNLKGLIGGLLHAPIHKDFYNEIKLSLSSAHSIKYPLRKWLTHQNYTNEFKKFDIIHIHFCHPNFVEQVIDLPKNKKLICSIWGSDILQTVSPYHIYNQRKAFLRADVITIQTEELKKIFVGKYGSDLKHKITIIQFGVPQQIFDAINDLNHNKKKLIETQINKGINPHLKKIVIGSNRSCSNNHIKIIHELAKIDDELKSQIQLILPFGYGQITEQYFEKVEQALNKAGFQHLILNKYITGEDLAALRLSSDIYIQMPETDALSATMTEFLYAGSHVIAGNWLPYSFFNKLLENDNRFTLIPNFDSLVDAVISALHSNEQKRINPLLLKTSTNNILPQWAALYKNLKFY